MAAAAVVFILYLVSSGPLPDLTAVASFADKAACQSAAATVNGAAAKGQDAKMAVCISSDALSALGKNGVSK